MAGSLAGFAVLAVAVANEPVLPVAFVTLFSPGLRLAKILVPGRHEPLGWTLGWFLRIAMAGNALFYFVLFTIVDYGWNGFFGRAKFADFGAGDCKRARKYGNRGKRDSPKGAPHHPSGSDCGLPKTLGLARIVLAGQANTMDSDATGQIVAAERLGFLGRAARLAESTARASEGGASLASPLTCRTTL